jgi:hypothetical protein
MILRQIERALGRLEVPQLNSDFLEYTEYIMVSP